MKEKKSEAAILDLLGEDAITLDTIDDLLPTERRKIFIEPQHKMNSAAEFVKKKESLALISHERCEPWAYADRSEEEMGNIESLAISIKKYGQQEPILVRPKHDVTSEVEYEVIFGNRRWRACASLNIPVKAIIKSLTDQEAAISQKEENENREGISDYSKAIFYKKMLDNKIFSSIGSLANNMGIGKSTLLDLLSYTRISQEIISAMPNPHKLSRKAAAKLATLSSANKDTIENLILLAPDIVAGKIPARKIESELNKRLNPDYVQNLTKALFSLTTHNNGDLTILIPKDQVKNINLEELNNLLTEHFNLKKQPVGRPTINL